MNTDINYIAVLDYLEHNRENHYSKPDTVTDPTEKQRFLEVKQKGQNAVAEIKKMATLCKDDFGLDYCSNIPWIDGSNTKTRNCLWAQLKYMDCVSDPTSISIFVEMENEKEARYRISLEIKNDGIDKATIARYHSHLDLPLNQADGLTYVSGSNEWGCPEPMRENQNKIRDMVKAGEIRKVQICKYIEPKPGQTNDYFQQEMLDAVKALLPYYDHVVGKAKKESDEMDSVEEKSIVKENVEFDKNMILCGPPGTGKTYNTAIYAVAICEGKSVDSILSESYEDVMVRYNELKKEGRIEFTTFHQSYGYEEFIEGIKPVVDGENTSIEYTIEPGVFKHFCDKAGRKHIITDDGTKDMSGARVWCVLLDGSRSSKLKERCFEEGTIRIGWRNSPATIDADTEGVNETERRILLNFQDEMSVGDIVVTQHSNTSIDGIAVITGDYEYDKEDEWPRKRSVKWLMKEKEVSITSLNDGKHLDRKSVYELKRISSAQILGLIENPKAVAITKEKSPYVFIIDEINRGNISKIFGELITLIEETKREGNIEQASAILPYSREQFSVPDNVYIIGTMNTADRSIALMDTALRRRFQFVEMMPDVQVLRNIHADKVEDLDVAAMLETINERITFLYDREHTIGHAFFTTLRNSPTLETLKSIFEKSVIPLLQEYFYDDYQKIQLVLGDNGKTDPNTKFILDEEIKVRSIFKGNADDVVDLPEKKYIINKNAFLNLDSYKQIM